MSYHLTERNLIDIEDQIRKMRRITWARVHDRVQAKLGLPHSISTLKKNLRIQKAYAARKKALLSDKAAKKAKSMKTHVPNDPVAYIAQLEERESALFENLKTVLANAVQLGVPLERMELPLEPVSYSPTPKSGR